MRMAATGSSAVQAKRTPPSEKSMLPSAARLSLARVARGLFRLALLLVAARTLGPEPFGIYALLLTVNELLLFISGGGFIDYVTREAARHPANAYTLAARLTQLRCLYLLGLIALAVPVLRLLGYSQAVIGNTLLLSVALFPRSINESCKGLLRAAHAFQRFLWVEVLEGGALVGTGTLLLLLRGAGIRGLIWAEMAAAGLGALVALRMVLQLFPAGQGMRFEWKAAVRKTYAFNIYPIIVDIYDRVDVVLLSKLAGNAAVGLYVMPYRILPMLQVLPYGLMGVLLPTLSATEQRPGEKESSSQALGLLYASALFFALGAMLLSDVGIALALGLRYQGSAVALKILIWATIPMFLNNVYNTLLLARNREKVFLATASVCMVANIASNLVLIPLYSYRAAAAVTILTELVLLAQNVVLVKRTLGYLPLPHNLAGSSLAFAVMLTVALPALRWVPPLVVGGVAVVVFGTYLYASRTVQFSLRSHSAAMRS